MGRSDGNERKKRDTARPVLALPTEIDIHVEYGCRCIRAYYAAMWAEYLALRGCSFRGIAKAYDTPVSKAKRYCIWYEIYQYAKNAGLNPLWCLDYAMRDCVNAARDINLRSAMDTSKKDAHASHGKLMALERISSVKASIRSIEAAAVDFQIINNMSRVGAVVAACNQVQPDKLLLVVLYDKHNVKLDISEIKRSRLLFAASPQAYTLSSEFMRKFNIGNYFNWSVVADVEPVDLRCI